MVTLYSSKNERSLQITLDPSDIIEFNCEAESGNLHVDVGNRIDWIEGL